MSKMKLSSRRREAPLCCPNEEANVDVLTEATVYLERLL